MARPRTPTAKLEVAGAFKRNPQRKRAGEPVVTTPIGEPPKMNPGALAAWHEIVAGAPEGVLTSADRISVEVAAHLLAEFRASPVEIPATKLVRLESLLGKFGMTPSDRSKLNIAKADDEENPFDALFGGGSKAN